MFGLSFITQVWIETFLFVFLRFSGWIIVSPVFGRKNVPGMIRIGFGLLMTMIIMMILPIPVQSINGNLFDFFIRGVKEMILGMLLGYINLVVFHLAVSTGQIIDMQIGFGMSNFFDPQFGIQVPLTGNFMNILMMIVFFTVNGHHMLISLMYDSFRMLEPGNVVFGLQCIKELITYFIWFFVLVIKVALPIIAVSVIVEFGLGIIIKTMPQMNMFVVGIPLKIVLGLFVLIIFLPTFVLIIELGFDQMYLWQRNIMQGLIVK